MGLIEDAKKAKELGYASYGAYMQAKPPAVPKRVLDVMGPRCVECGSLLPPGKRKLCSESCQKKRNNKLWRRRYYS